MRASPRAQDRAKIPRPRASPQITGPLRTHPRAQIPALNPLSAIATFGSHASPRWLHTLPDDNYTARAAARPNGTVIVALTIYGEAEFDGVTVGAPDQQTLVLAQFGLIPARAGLIASPVLGI